MGRGGEADRGELESGTLFFFCIGQVGFLTCSLGITDTRELSLQSYVPIMMRASRLNN